MASLTLSWSSKVSMEEMAVAPFLTLVAGSTCKDWSSMGSQKGFFGLRRLHLSSWHAWSGGCDLRCFYMNVQGPLSGKSFNLMKVGLACMGWCGTGTPD